MIPTLPASPRRFGGVPGTDICEAVETRIHEVELEGAESVSLI